MANPLHWPIVIISTQNDFLHLGRDPMSLQDHIARDPRENGGAELQFYDSDGQALEPLLTPNWLPTAFRLTGQSIDGSELLSRMKAAVEAGHTTAGRPFSPSLGPLSGESVNEYADRLLNDASYSGAFDSATNAPLPGRGGWLHNAWHAAFG